ncbi:hypothetical protein IPL85_02525 [Candidatus Saccharibacteria bacterium]|nr:MAG: hypothetical protein IPL85_02525 [Candidatus Saccharibacteria bacterium]
MEDQQKQLVAKLKDAQNVLVTVSKNPSVDQLSAAIGLTLALNKLDKHATAVYSGQTPSTIEFLKPEDTLEGNTDSLRDFIIALDKSKADKLRYKVEDQVVRIFITPYRTSISEQDLDFSQGDFNVDVVVALGVHQQVDFDDAIQAHGRILHDATISTVSIGEKSELGTLNVVNASASSLCEVTTKLVVELGKDMLDSQIATALLTGIVAMTERFSNDRTTPETMRLSATLMAAGANQQLIANELSSPLKDQEQTDESSVNAPVATSQKEPGTLEISHDGTSGAEDLTESTPSDEQADSEAVEEAMLPEATEQQPPQIQVDENGKIISEDESLDAERPLLGQARAVGDIQPPLTHDEPVTRGRMVEPPSRSGDLTANTQEEGLDASAEELTLPPFDTPMLSHTDPGLESPKPDFLDNPQPVTDTPSAGLDDATVDQANTSDSTGDSAPDTVIDTETQTLTEIESAVGSSRAEDAPDVSGETTVDDARSAVKAAFAANPVTQPTDPITALNAQPLGPDLHAPEVVQPTLQPAPGFGALPTPLVSEPLPGGSPADQTLDMPVPSATSAQLPLVSSVFPGSVQNSAGSDASLAPPPPVPPPPIFPTA